MPRERDRQPAVPGDDAQGREGIASRASSARRLDDQLSEQCPRPVRSPDDPRAGRAVEQLGTREELDHGEGVVVAQLGEVDSARETVEPEVEDGATDDGGVIGSVDRARPGRAQADDRGDATSGDPSGECPSRLDIEGIDVVDHDHALDGGRRGLVTEGSELWASRGIERPEVDGGQRARRPQLDGQLPVSLQLGGDRPQQITPPAPARPRDDEGRTPSGSFRQYLGIPVRSDKSSRPLRRTVFPHALLPPETGRRPRGR